MPRSTPDSVRPVAVRYIAATATYSLRAAVLRPGLPLEAAVFPGDTDPTTAHLGAFSGGELVGIASVYREAPPGAADAGAADAGAVDAGPADASAWRLRGMATLPQVRGQGFGKALVAACLEHVAARGGTRLWCNARTEAVGFYRKLGFATAGDEFDIPGVGPHYMMWRRP